MDELSKINEIVDSKSAVINVYTRERTNKVLQDLDSINNLYKDFHSTMEKTFEKASKSGEYYSYIEYIISEDFDKREKAFISKVEDTILKSLPKKSNLLPIYASLAIIFILQIVLFLR